MAIYKRYNTRRKKINLGIIIWAVAMVCVLALTALLGAYLGRRAEGSESYLGVDGSFGDRSETLASVIPHVMQAVYVAPNDLAGFTSEDASLYASTWLYRDGEVCFASEVANALGADTSDKPSRDAFGVSVPVSGMFEVGSVYASDAVRGVLFEYEKALLGELAKSGPDETVLVYRDLNEENLTAVADNAAALGGGVIAVPYGALYESYFARFLGAATEKGFTLALMADGVSAEQLANDIEDYAVYFTRDFMRLMLDGDDAELLTVLREKNILNYQFYS